MTRRFVTLAIVAAVALTGCSKKPSASDTPSAQSVVSSTPEATGTASPAATSTSSGGATKTTAPPTGPRIEYYRVKTKPSCPSSGPGASFPGNGIELEWKVAGGPTQVTISIDSPGLFGTYSATHTETFPFGCGGTSGTIQKHNYILKVLGTNLQQTITGEARVN